MEVIERALSSPSLPSLPGVALQVLRLAQDPDVSIHRLADVVSKDPALTGKILRTVNSLFYALRKSVSSLSRAVVVLGINGVRTLTLSFSLAGELRRSSHARQEMDAYWRRSV